MAGSLQHHCGAVTANRCHEDVYYSALELLRAFPSVRRNWNVSSQKCVQVEIIRSCFVPEEEEEEEEEEEKKEKKKKEKKEEKKNKEEEEEEEEEKKEEEEEEEKE
jgi:isoaspartyl peptidase/L-asparaginase-like protein (Ntn-hydrolase superfamily)